MTQLVADCPRCGAKHTTAEVKACVAVGKNFDWQVLYEAIGFCRNCTKSVIYLIKMAYPGAEPPMRYTNATLNGHYEIVRSISLVDNNSLKQPEHLPADIGRVFNEACSCMKISCYNAAGTMFRLCVDLATKPLLPAPDTPGISSRQRRDLGLRLQWLFENGALSRDFEGLAACIREDGNDAAHAGTISQEDADDLLDFSFALLDRLISEPCRLAEARERRDRRRNPNPE